MAKLKKYAKAYNIDVTGLLEKDEFIDKLIAARVSAYSQRIRNRVCLCVHPASHPLHTVVAAAIVYPPATMSCVHVSLSLVPWRDRPPAIWLCEVLKVHGEGRIR